MAAETDHVGDCPEDLESADDEEQIVLGDRVFKYPDVLAVLQGHRNTDVLTNLPPAVKRRIKALKKLQFAATNIEAKFFEEVHAIECKYHNLYTPLYQKRSTIVSGEYEPNDDESQWASDEEEEISKDLKEKVKIEEAKETKEPAKEEPEVAGIPEFWLTIFKNVGLLSEMVQDHDEPILKHLKDIQVKFIEKPMGFVLEFHFEQNEYFTNTILTKEYDMKCTPDEEDPFGFEGPEIYKCRGCSINWNKGKNVTLKTVKKKQKHKSRGLVRTVTKMVQNDSFFNFFSPAAIPDESNGAEVDEETRNLLTSDFEIGHYIRERIVPRAVLYFTGEGIEDEEDYEEEEDDEEEEEEDSDHKESNSSIQPVDQNCKQQ